MDGRVIKAMRLLEGQMTEIADFGAVAAAVGLSRHRLHHLFVAEAGETPGGYLRRIRLDLAAMRLRWTRETAGEIANGLGYASQSSFNRAFSARFGATPYSFRRDVVRWPNWPLEGADTKGITIRESEGLHCVARRYMGPLGNVPGKWTDFLSKLPDGLVVPGQSLFLGCAYDDPRFTLASQIRYDCCVTLLRPPEPGADPLPDGFFHQTTRAGLYAAVEHKGDYATTIGSTYSRILDYWMASSSRYVMADDPAIEVYAMPPGQSPGDELRCNLLIPLI